MAAEGVRGRYAAVQHDGDRAEYDGERGGGDVGEAGTVGVVSGGWGMDVV